MLTDTQKGLLASKDWEALLDSLEVGTHERIPFQGYHDMKDFLGCATRRNTSGGEEGVRYECEAMPFEKYTLSLRKRPLSFEELFDTPQEEEV